MLHNASFNAEPSFPTVATGTPYCILPITTLYCVVDTRSGFVAGIQYGSRSGARVKDVVKRVSAIHWLKLGQCCDKSKL
jgi:hypothetical protein